MRSLTAKGTARGWAKEPSSYRGEAERIFKIHSVLADLEMRGGSLHPLGGGSLSRLHLWESCHKEMSRAHYFLLNATLRLRLGRWLCHQFALRLIILRTIRITGNGVLRRTTLPPPHDDFLAQEIVVNLKEGRHCGSSANEKSVEKSSSWLVTVMSAAGGSAYRPDCAVWI